MVFFLAVTPFVYIYDPELFNIFELIDIIFWITALIGVYCYSYQKVMLSLIFWRCLLPLVILWDVFFYVYAPIDEPLEYDAELIVISVVAFIVLVLPEYIALYILGYRSKGLWDEKEI